MILHTPHLTIAQRTHSGALFPKSDNGQNCPLWPMFSQPGGFWAYLAR